MDLKPINAVWEITMGCNMRCKHCGSICEEPLADELTTEEALDLARQLGDIGMKFISLSGGEPTTRKDWPLIAKELRKSGVVPNMISNGWLIDEEVAKTIKEAGIATVAISVDGLKEHHDYMRREGSYDRCMRSIKALVKAGVPATVISTVSSENIDTLPEMREKFIEQGVSYWQIQTALPMGNFKKDNNMVNPKDIDRIIDFAYENLEDDRIIIDLPDCIGYYNLKEIAVKNKRLGTTDYNFQGCSAGRQSIGILQNGEIVGCTSMRESMYSAGSIREQSLKEIWEDDNNFTKFRTLKKADLKGVCQTCAYGDICLGGCPNVRICTEGEFYSENRFCSYSNAVYDKMEEQEKMSHEEIKTEAFEALEEGYYQLAAMSFKKLLETEKDNIEYMSGMGYANYQIKNYNEAIEINERLVELKPEMAYSHKALGLSLYRAEEKERAFKHLYKAIELCDDTYMDPYIDLVSTLKEDENEEEAQRIYDMAAKKYPDFEKCYNSLQE